MVRYAMLSMALVAACAATAQAQAPAERPTAMRLFPQETVVFVRTASCADVAKAFRASSSGRFFAEPDVAGLVRTGLDRAQESAEEVQELTGGSLLQLAGLLQGEVAWGMVHRKNQRVAFLFLIDTQPRGADPTAAEGAYTAAKLLAALRAKAEADGKVINDEMIGADKAVVMREGEGDSVGTVQRGGVVLLANDKDLLAAMLARWDGRAPTPCLADKPAFQQAMRECAERRAGGDEAPPHMIGFVDPVGIVRAVAQNDTGARLALAMLPALGIDGIDGIAGALWLGAGDWEWLGRAHLLLDNPRSGVLKVVRLDPCDGVPGPGVPESVASHSIGALDPVATFDRISALHDAIRGEGTFAKLVEENVSSKAGEPLRDSILAAFTGRVESFTGYGADDPDTAPRIEPERALLLRVHDPEQGSEMLKRIIDKVKESGAEIEEAEHLGVPYFRAVEPPQDDEERRFRERPRPALGIVGDDFVVCQSDRLMRRLIETHEGDAARLADSISYRVVQGRAKRLASESGASAEGIWVNYADPTEQTRRMHGAWESEAGREQLDRMAEFAPPIRWLRDTLEEGGGAPPLETMLKYAAPSGSVLYDTPSGYRYVSFQFKPAGE
ncbi:MAG: hypothetical protein ACRCT8_05305 [Lacipirellulaceae bacterium]